MDSHTHGFLPEGLEVIEVGRRRAAFFNSLIVTAELNDVDPQAWLAGVLGRIASRPAQRLGALLPWNWKPTPAMPTGLDAAA